MNYRSPGWSWAEQSRVSGNPSTKKCFKIAGLNLSIQNIGHYSIFEYTHNIGYLPGEIQFEIPNANWNKPLST